MADTADTNTGLSYYLSASTHRNPLQFHRQLLYIYTYKSSRYTEATLALLNKEFDKDKREESGLRLQKPPNYKLIDTIGRQPVCQIPCFCQGVLNMLAPNWLHSLCDCCVP